MASAAARALSEEFATKQEAYKAISEKYNSQASLVSGEENDRRREELLRLEDEIEELNFRLTREIKKAEESTYGPIRELIEKAIAEVALDQELNLVVSSSASVYHTPDIDITEAVIALLDAP